MLIESTSVSASADDVFAAGEDKGVVAFAAALGGVFNSAPECYEVVDGGDGGDSGHVVDANHGDKVDGHDEPPEVHDVPAVVKDREADGDDLDHSFELAHVAGLNGETFRRGDGAEAGDQKFASNDKDSDPWFYDVRVVLDQSDVGGGDEQLIGEGIEQHTHGSDLAAPASEVAIDPVGNGDKDEEDSGYDLLLAVESTVEKMGREHPDEDGDGGNAADRDGVGQIHRV